MDAFGFDPHRRLVDVIGPMAGDRTIVPVQEAGRFYNPGNVRWYDPGKGGLRAHAGNEFIPLIEDGAMSHLLTTTKVFDHMSYFVVLQRPEQGGTLSVYDLLWRDHNDHATPWDSATRDDSFFDTETCMKIDAGPGDLVLFGGGWRWHRIDPVQGNIPRITYGGFMCESVGGTELHMYS
jgi:hypothetical protein